MNLHCSEMADQESPASPTPTQPDTPRHLSGDEILSAFGMIIQSLNKQSANINDIGKDAQGTGRSLFMIRCVWGIIRRHRKRHYICLFRGLVHKRDTMLDFFSLPATFVPDLSLPSFYPPHPAYSYRSY